MRMVVMQKQHISPFRLIVYALELICFSNFALRSMLGDINTNCSDHTHTVLEYVLYVSPSSVKKY